MNASLFESLKEQNICLLGFGTEGQSTYRTLRKYFPDKLLAIADINPDISKHPLLHDDRNITLHTGDKYLESLNQYDVIIKSPGIPFRLLDKTDKERITSQTAMFIRAFRRQIIGITGTKGKSTTSSLIYHIILKHTPDVLLVGNIGVPPFDMLDKISDQTLIVFELSSHQLEHLHVSPHIAVLLNIYEEHLDHYRTFHDYELAKFNIAKFQEEEDYFIFNADDKNIQKLIEEYIPRGKFLPYSFSAELENGCMLSDYDILYLRNHNIEFRFDSTVEKHLKGDHNLMNIMAAICACKSAGIPNPAIESGITGFIPLEHRIEYVGRFHGIDFYNDSIATIPEASMAAIKSVNHIDTLILGGMDRGVDYTAFIEFLVNSDIRNIAFMGKAGERMMNLINNCEHHGKKLFHAQNLKEAVEWAKKHTAPGKACLLSPAAPSYDAYKNFAERGTAFKQMVKE